MPLVQVPYNREAVYEYAKKWAFSRNPNFYDFSDIGGDCTNFASQCCYAGCGVMNYEKTYGWYYIDINDRAPAWTSVVFFHRFMTENTQAGPYGVDTDITRVEVGDFVQIRFNNKLEYGHTPIITRVNYPHPSGILVAAHTNDAFDRPLSTYQNVAEFRYIHIIGARKWE